MKTFLHPLVHSSLFVTRGPYLAAAALKPHWVQWLRTEHSHGQHYG